MSIERLKQSVKRIPWAHWAARQLLHRSQNLDQRPGDWLYHHQIVSWLNNDTLRRQLPATLRFFAYYCGLQKDFRDRVFGGERVFKAAMAITRLFRLKDYVGLDLGDHKVFLNLYDPRMLQVPNELLSGDSDTCVLQEFVSSGDTFVDVGANHGSFSLVAARRVGPCGLIVAIEPQARLATLVEKSLAASAPCRYQVHRIACGDRDGMADFYVPWATSGSAGLFPKFSATAEHRRFSVAVKRFDDAVNWRSFPGQVFIKLDVEGSELAFLRGASSMVISRKPHIMFEVNPLSMNAAGISRAAMIQCLQDLGYCHYVELHALGEPRELERLDATRQRNIIFVSPAQRAARLAVPSIEASRNAIADNCPGRVR